MEKILKSNIQSRQASLLEGHSETSLFTHEGLKCKGFYLAQHQEQLLRTREGEVMQLTIFQGCGELKVDGKDPWHVPLLAGDIVLVPSQIAYTISNTGDQILIFSALLIAAE